MQFLQGIDLVKVERVKKIYEEYGEKFLEKIFSSNEINQIKKLKIFNIKKLLQNFQQKKLQQKH